MPKTRYKQNRIVQDWIKVIAIFNHVMWLTIAVAKLIWVQHVVALKQEFTPRETVKGTAEVSLVNQVVVPHGFIKPHPVPQPIRQTEILETHQAISNHHDVKIAKHCGRTKIFEWFIIVAVGDLLTTFFGTAFVTGRPHDG